MFALIHTDPINYANDNTLCAIANSLQEAIQKLVANGNIPIDSFTHNDMQVNPSKFHFMVTGINVIQLTLRAATIEQEDCVKLLGVNIDKKLDFKFHVNEICRKAGRQLNALRRQSRLVNIQSKMKVFNTFIRANLNYCPLMWVHRKRTDLARLENVQERALRLVYSDKDCSYYEQLIMAKVPSVLIKWQIMLTIEAFKALQGISPPYIQDLFREKDVPYNLRATKIVIQPTTQSTTHGLNSLTYQGVKLWISLPEHIEDAETVGQFQSYINNHLL